MVFAREVADQELTFGVSGKLIMNALVMYDHQTDSLWSQFLGKAVKGELADTRLVLLPAQVVTWNGWKELHPDTTALDKTAFSGSDPYASYYGSGDKGILGESHEDDRLPAKELVIGVVEGTVQRAYPFRYLRNSPVLNDEVNGQPVVVTSDPGTGAAAIFSREKGGRVLSFRSARSAEGRLFLAMEDQETGSTWNAATGMATRGPLAGERLTPLPSHLSFWFAWTDFYPSTELYQPSGSTSGA